MDKNNCKVLIADDSKFMLGMIKRMVSDVGYNVVATAENGVEAIAMAKEHEPDLILLDINMPVKNGIEALQQIVEDLPDAIVIMMTSDASAENVANSIELGAVNYILKDDEKEDILSTIEECLEFR